MTIKNKIKNSSNPDATEYWVEVKDINYISYPKTNVMTDGKKSRQPHFMLGVNDYDDNEYILNFDPVEFLNWVDRETLVNIIKAVKDDLDDKV
jgi:hypothetical protein